MRQLFPETEDTFGNRQMSTLQLMVVGLRPGAIDRHIRDPAIDLNYIDAQGECALGLAVKGQKTYIEMSLLTAGADPLYIN
jgi:hypothetical protein